jgi:predicted AlkP superfamily phosphohydrolase/phosphomutase
LKASLALDPARPRRARAAVLALIAAALVVAPSVPPRAAAPGGRVVVLGFDGADARLVEKWMDEGKLPNLARLRSDGTFSPLLPTNPAQTPVSWSSFATGNNPGRTQIFDFLKRLPKSYIPTIAMADESKRPFLFGTKNPLGIGLIGGAALALLVFLVLSLLRARVSVRALAGLAAGAAAFACLFWVAARFLPADVPWAVNNRKGETFWHLAAASGRIAEIFRVPVTFPAEDVGQGRMLSGLGVPDIRGTIGRPTYFTSDPSASLGDNEFSLELERLPARAGVIETRVIGPYNKAFYGYVLERATQGITDPDERRRAREDAEQGLKDRGIARQITIPMTLETSGGSLKVRISGTEFSLKPGEWSDWVELRFPVNALIDRVSPVRGIVRFQLFSLEPELRLWMSPVNFHPEFHPVPFTWPASYSNELYKAFGYFKTIGWTEDTWSLPTGVGDEQHFLDDMNASIDKDQEMMEKTLAKKDSQLYVQVFSFTDRIGHLFWRFIDPGHPLYDAAKAAQYGPEIEKAYARMDTIVGKARAVLGPDDVMVVCSDHGFSSFRRGVSYNTWLVRHGFMTLNGAEEGARNLEDLFDKHGEALFANVDWSRTKAYAMGLGNIYVNLYGREPQGIVQEGEEYEAVVKGIKDGLEALVDEKTGEKPVTHVYRRDEIYSGFDPALIPDLRVANALNYRVSWQTTLGGVPPDVIEDNLKAWSADHCSNEPALVKGIFFSSRKIASKEDPRIWDLAPSILSLVGAPIPSGLDGKNLYGEGAAQ